MKFRAITPIGSSVNETNGVISGVAIITQGAVKGHGMLCDAKTLETVRQCIQDKYKSGLKVKFNSETWNHGDGAICGLIPVSTLKEDNGVLRGDLQLAKNYANREYLLELAKEMGDTFGLSIDFENDPETINGVEFARCSDIYAVTIVDEPAANSGGLFSLPNDNKQKDKPMALTEADKAELKTMFSTVVAPAITEAMKPLDARLTKIETQLTAGNDAVNLSEVSAEELADAGVKESDSKEVKLSKVKAFRASADKPLTMRGLTTFVREVGGRPLGASGAATGNDGENNGSSNNGHGKKTSFEAKVEELSSALGGDKGRATRLAVDTHPDIYRAHCEAKGLKKRAA